MMVEVQSGTQRPTDHDIEMASPNREATAYSGHIPWTSTHAFYATMGGFAIDTGTLREEQKFLPYNRERLTLTPAGLKFLAQQRSDLIPLVPREEIRDKMLEISS